MPTRRVCQFNKAYKCTTAVSVLAARADHFLFNGKQGAVGAPRKLLRVGGQFRLAIGQNWELSAQPPMDKRMGNKPFKARR